MYFDGCNDIGVFRMNANIKEWQEKTYVSSEIQGNNKLEKQYVVGTAEKQQNRITNNYPLILIKTT